MKRKTFFALALLAVASTNSAIAAEGLASNFQARELDGNSTNGPEAFYDSARNVTWLADGDVAGPMTWDDAQQWAQTLVVGTTTNWRLPKMQDFGKPGCDLSYTNGTDCGYNVPTNTSELASLFSLLGNKGFYSPSGETGLVGWGLTSTAPFRDLQPNYYWFGTNYAPAPNDMAWAFDMRLGFQGAGGKQNNLLHAIAVIDGDVQSVPEPGTGALGITALLVVLALRRTRQAKQLALVQAQAE
jgi:hypothetical protein